MTMDPVTINLASAASAFEEWDRRYREDPDQFDSDMARIMRGQTTGDYGDVAAAYFLELLADVDGDIGAETGARA